MRKNKLVLVIFKYSQYGKNLEEKETKLNVTLKKIKMKLNKLIYKILPAKYVCFEVDVQV